MQACLLLYYNGSLQNVNFCDGYGHHKRNQGGSPPEGENQGTDPGESLSYQSLKPIPCISFKRSNVLRTLPGSWGKEGGVSTRIGRDSTQKIYLFKEKSLSKTFPQFILGTSYVLLKASLPHKPLPVLRLPIPFAPSSHRTS